MACDVLREWALSVRGLYLYELPKEYRDLTSSTPAYLENCPQGRDAGDSRVPQISEARARTEGSALNI